MTGLKNIFDSRFTWSMCVLLYFSEETCESSTSHYANYGLCSNVVSKTSRSSHCGSCAAMCKTVLVRGTQNHGSSQLSPCTSDIPKGSCLPVCNVNRQRNEHILLMPINCVSIVYDSKRANLHGTSEHFWALKIVVSLVLPDCDAWSPFDTWSFTETSLQRHLQCSLCLTEFVSNTFIPSLRLLLHLHPILTCCWYMYSVTTRPPACIITSSILRMFQTTFYSVWQLFKWLQFLLLLISALWAFGQRHIAMSHLVNSPDICLIIITSHRHLFLTCTHLIIVWSSEHHIVSCS